MAMTPYPSPDPGKGIRKGRMSFAIPGRASHAGCSLLAQAVGGQCDNRVEAQQRWRRASNGALIPLALCFHAQMPPRFFKRHFHPPATDKPGPLNLSQFVARKI